ncbi:MAG: SRPBCC family protein [Chloroflexi bacterium]|nr:SRPBCC family protein [Chloroflexota bacterium]MDA1003830.1 SRPBCC family protein [Chloroflexota bacterium]
MPAVSVSQEVDAPAARTWAVATDIARVAEVLSAVNAVERLDGGDGFAVGTRWRETRRMFGRDATEEMEVTAVDPGRGYTVEAESHGTHYTSHIRVESLDDARSRIEMSFDAQAGGPVARVLAATLGRLAMGSTRRALAQDLADIAAAAEHGA